MFSNDSPDTLLTFTFLTSYKYLSVFLTIPGPVMILCLTGYEYISDDILFAQHRYYDSVLHNSKGHSTGLLGSPLQICDCALEIFVL